MVDVAFRPGEFPYRELGRRIAQLRGEDLSQRELARRVGISEGYIGRIETGRNRPDAAILQEIARTLGADYEELAALAGYMAPRRGDRQITIPDEYAAVFQRFLRYSARQVEAAERMLRIWMLEAAPPQEQAEGQSAEEVEDEEERNESDAQTQ